MMTTLLQIGELLFRDLGRAGYNAQTRLRETPVLSNVSTMISATFLHGIAPLVSRPQHAPAPGSGLVGECEDLYAFAQTKCSL
jgi:hypothetical protein